MPEKLRARPRAHELGCSYGSRRRAPGIDGMNDGIVWPVPEARGIATKGRGRRAVERFDGSPHG